MQRHLIAIVRRLTVVVLEKLLPDASALVVVLLGSIWRSMLAMVVVGVLVASLVLLGCFGFYHMLLAEGILAGYALLWSLVLILVFVVVFAFVAYWYATKAEQAKESMSSFSHNKQLADDVEEIVVAFLEGVFSQSVRSATSAPTEDPAQKV